MAEIFLSEEILPNTTSISSNSTQFLKACTFEKIGAFADLITLFKTPQCYRYSIFYTAFLCIVNLVILVFGLVGNALVIYVVICKLKAKTASSIFILNLAVADLLVILFCIPATFVANLFTPWIFGETVCKLVAYGQGVAVFSSVYSLVAITFDRFRAIHHKFGLSPSLSPHQAMRLVIVIWIIGIIITLPWAIVFHVKHMTFEDADFHNETILELPFCREIWGTKMLEIWYFLLIHVFACFLLPLLIITVCNFVMWRNVLKHENYESMSSSQSSIIINSSCSSVRDVQRQRKLRMLKLFTGLTFAFFIFWLPLYIIMARVKFAYTESFSGSETEQQLISVLIPLTQLLGSCNSCVNPVLYALLNQTFRESFKSMCPWCFRHSTSAVQVAKKNENSTTIVLRVSRFSNETAV